MSEEESLFEYEEFCLNEAVEIVRMFGGVASSRSYIFWPGTQVKSLYRKFWNCIAVAWISPWNFNRHEAGVDEEESPRKSNEDSLNFITLGLFIPGFRVLASARSRSLTCSDAYGRQVIYMHGHFLNSASALAPALDPQGNEEKRFLIHAIFLNQTVCYPAKLEHFLLIVNMITPLINENEFNSFVASSATLFPAKPYVVLH